MTTLVRKNQNQGWLPLFFNDFFRDDWKAGAGAHNTVPAINVKETGQAFCIEVAAAGMTKEDFNVSIDEDNDLVITVENKNETNDENKDARYLRREFSYSKFQQTLVLPENVNKDRIDAKVENGVLYINLPKLSENEIQKKQRSVAIK
ncbi:MAG: Hsp20/alpha crystallin family protein [Tannerella sp.]|jgi:HSP20 family protein|nr:Hsp20/alpha crystallin family protein [Tannerella sp.]